MCFATARCYFALTPGEAASSHGLQRAPRAALQPRRPVPELRDRNTHLPPVHTRVFVQEPAAGSSSSRPA